MRALRKMPKAYLWDASLVVAPGPRFENLVALHLLKLCHYLQDHEGFDVDLTYVRDRAGREVDFLVTIANVSDSAIYRRGMNLEAFWSEEAATFEWFRTWDKVLEWNCPFATWFVGGKLNITVNCIDRHLQTWRRNKAALIWEGEPGDERVLT
jgi:hypothetical protein